MNSNFEFLKTKDEFKSFRDVCVEAERSILVSPATCAIISRRALEVAVKWLYTFDNDLVMPYQDNISSLIHNQSFKDLIDSSMFPLLKYVIKLGNVAVHTSIQIKRDEAILSLHNLHQFVSWIDYCYADEYTAKDFDESILLVGEEKRTRPEKLKDLYDKLSSKDKKLQEIIKQNEELRKQLTEKRKINVENYNFNVDEISEAETRKRYIDVELKLAGWDFNKNIVIEEELQGMPNSSNTGFADYVLYGANGKPLAVVEAKRSNKDPKVGQQQAKLYADCLQEKYGQRPIIFYTNGFETYIVDDLLGYCERRIYGFKTEDELQLMIDRRSSRKSLKNIDINDDISNRYYQKEAIVNVCEALEDNQRRFILVMATGTGKTRTAISIVDILTRHNWVKNILFLADRKALVRQAKNNFSKLLPNLSLCNLLDSKDNPEESRMIFSTYPTMMNAIDDTRRKDGKKLFTPGHFDLIIVDESHRSIYKKFKAIFEYFDAYLLGLTATPKEEVDKNTYSVFNLESGVPTYAYELEKAVQDGYLVDYNVIKSESKVMRDGIKYNELSEEDKDIYDDTFDDDEDIAEEIENTAINNWLFNEETIDLVLQKLMEKGLRIKGEEELGKTIIFAKKSKHAEVIVKRFNELFPELGPDYCKEIDNSIGYSDSLIDDFSDANKKPQIAVSVDMLDTGIDIPEILNLVFFKKIRSNSKFWQMIGRGTRLCKDLLAAGIDKEKFLVFDFCNNFDFFEVNPKGFEGVIGKSLSERIFDLKIDIVKELQDLRYSNDSEYAPYRKELLENLMLSVDALNEDNFRVRIELKYVHKYKNKDSWSCIGAVEGNELKEHIAPIIMPLTDDEYAKRFDVTMYTIQLAKLQGANANKPVQKVISTAEALSRKGTIPEVKAKQDIIEKAMTEEFYESADIFELDNVREALRELIRYLDKHIHNIYTTNFDDMIVRDEEGASIYNANDLKNYRKKVEHYLKEHEDDLVIYKLRNNEKLTNQDIKTLEKILWSELGSKSDYEREYKEKPIKKLVRSIVGLDRTVANGIFSEFLDNKSLNSKQIHFVELIVDYVVKNGFMEDKRVLQQEPFRNIGSIVELFKDNMNDARGIMGKIDSINYGVEDIG